LAIVHTDGFSGTPPALSEVEGGGREFDKVKVKEMPDMKQKVAAAMADKYWMDVLVRHESHPMVARLVPETPPSETPSH
jgi:hypothetical protein